jgi:hypothetical protein
MEGACTEELFGERNLKDNLTALHRAIQSNAVAGARLLLLVAPG